MVSTGQPSLSLPVVAETPSGQHPNSVSLHGVCGQFSPLALSAGVTPSEQHPYWVSWQVDISGQPKKMEYVDLDQQKMSLHK